MLRHERLLAAQKESVRKNQKSLPAIRKSLLADSSPVLTEKDYAPIAEFRLNFQKFKLDFSGFNLNF